MDTFKNLINIQDKGSDKEAEFSVMSFNVRLFNAYDWIKKKDDLKYKITEYLKQRTKSVYSLPTKNFIQKNYQNLTIHTVILTTE